ncbi:MAG: YbjN domain-containing protein [Rhodospirillaceae bacterium]
MTTVVATAETATPNPIDVIETVVALKEWTFERRSEQEMAVEVPGHWCDYGLFFAWSEELDALHFSCAFDMRVPESRRTPIFELLSILNERLWVGHFSLWSETGIPMFRHTVLLNARETNQGAIEDLVEVAVGECERFYPAFQFTIWGGKSATEAVESALLETMGEA